MTTSRTSGRAVGAVCAVLAAGGALGQPLTTAFTYQGDLRAAGAPAEGPHDFRFRLFDAVSGGAQVGPTVCIDNAGVEGGRFTVLLDFGAQFAGQQRFLAVEARADAGLNCSNGVGFTALSPRQALTAAPNAAFSLTAGAAGNATQLNGQPAGFYQNAANLSAGTVPDGRLGGVYSGPLTLSNAGNAFTGSGAGLTGLSAGAIATGTLGDARLSANVALLNVPQAFTAAKTFAAAPAFTGAGAPFSVSSPSVVTNLNADLLDGLSSSAFLQQVPSPLGLSGSVGGDGIVKGTNSAAANFSAGVRGVSTAASGSTMGGLFESQSPGGRGVFANASAPTGTTVGGEFWNSSTSGIGVSGWSFGTSGETYGGWFRAESTEGRAVFGRANAPTGLNWGGYFEAVGTNGRGVQGMASAASGSTFGGRFESASPSGRGVQGMATATIGSTFGGRFETLSSSGVAVAGYAYGGSGGPWGVYGVSEGATGRGVVGETTYTTGITYGVYGRGAAPATNWGVYASGKLGASGTKSFRIDHPDDPENRYLLHYSTESPEVLNSYSGSVRLDGAGEAEVALPAYFAKINRDPRYTLTPVGAPMPALHVAAEIDEGALETGAAAGPGEPAPVCTFRIAGGAPGAKVCWEVKAVRNDRWVRAYGAPVEAEKQESERGKLQDPSLYGRPAEQGVDWRPAE